MKGISKAPFCVVFTDLPARANDFFNFALKVTLAFLARGSFFNPAAATSVLMGMLFPFFTVTMRRKPTFGAEKVIPVAVILTPTAVAANVATSASDELVVERLTSTVLLFTCSGCSPNNESTNAAGQYHSVYDVLSPPAAVLWGPATRTPNLPVVKLMLDKPLL